MPVSPHPGDTGIAVLRAGSAYPAGRPGCL